MTPSRYHRQELLPQIGPAGQRRLAGSRVLLVGCGALGTVIAEHLTRAGVGLLRIVDRDIVELTNLQRQTLFDENDVNQSVPKSIAAARRLSAINSSITLDPHVTDLHAGNVEELIGLNSPTRVHLIIDGTDNVETRYLLNDAAIKHNIPWLYGACIATEGRVMPILPPGGPCLRCVFPTPPSPADLPTCDTAGVLAPAAGAIASLESALALQILTAADPLTPSLHTLNLWPIRLHSIPLDTAKNPDCPCCGLRQFDFLTALSQTHTSLCGQNAIQIRCPAPISLQAMSQKLTAAGKLHATPYFLRCTLHDPSGITLTLFADGRIIVRGTADAARARALAARFVGA